MNKIIKFIKKIFTKKTLALNEGNIEIEKSNLSQREIFLNNNKINSDQSNILSLKIKLEQGIINENDLNDNQIKEMKKLYCNQILNLVNSVNNYKLKIANGSGFKWQ